MTDFVSPSSITPQPRGLELNVWDLYGENGPQVFNFGDTLLGTPWRINKVRHLEMSSVGKQQYRIPRNLQEVRDFVWKRLPRAGQGYFKQKQHIDRWQERAHKHNRMMYGRRRRRKTNTAISGYAQRIKGRTQKKLSKYVRNGVMWKHESGGVVADPQAVYVGSCTHPILNTVEMILMAVLRLVAKRMNCDFSNPRDPVQDDVFASSNPLLRCQIYWRATSASNIATTEVTTTDFNENWFSFMSKMRDAIFGIYNNAGTERLDCEIVKFMFYNVPGATDSQNLTIINLKDTYIKVVGSTILKVQNRTLAGQAVTEDADTYTSVQANPLTGKLYRGYGCNVNFRDSNTVVGSNVLQFDRRTGNATAVASGTYSTSQQLTLQKPPGYQYFDHFNSSINAKIGSGEIKIVKATRKHYMSMEKWFKVMLQYLASGATAAASAQFQNIHIGANVAFGFEKLVDTRTNEPDTTIGYETINNMSAIAYNRPMKLAVPYTIQT